MADQGGQNKTEKPTPRRREKARSEGQVAKSQELASVAVLGAGLISIWMFSGFYFENISGFLSHILGNVAQIRLNESEIHNIAISLMGMFFKLVAPIMGTVMVAAAVINLAQVGFMLVPKRIKPDFKKINPAQGIKKWFSLRTLVELFKNIGKLVSVGFIAYLTLEAEWENLPGLSGLQVFEILTYILGICAKLFFRILLLMIVLAILDWAYQKYEFEKNLKMSKQEIKDEFKQTEGDPQVKGRIRQMQRERARGRMMAEVPEADVVITNPTHFAIALKYDAQMEAPTVLAKGMNKVAHRIKEIARENGVPVVEDKPLARALYKAVEVGQSIPYELYEAVAGILAHIYRQKNANPFSGGAGA